MKFRLNLRVMAFFPLFSSVTTSVELNFLPMVSNIPFKTETLSLQPAWIKEHTSYVSLHRLTFAQGEISSEKGTAFLLPTLLVVIENGSDLILPYDNKQLLLLAKTDFFLAIQCCWLFISQLMLEIAQIPKFFCVFKLCK